MIVTVKHRLPGSAARAFDAWLDPLHAGEWLFATPHGRMSRLEIDARPGGKFVFIDHRAGQDVEHTGEYLELERPRRLVFTLSVPKYSPNVDRVAVEITSLYAKDGRERGCEIALTHELSVSNPASGDFDETEIFDRCRDGWNAVLEALAEHLAKMR